MSDANLFVISAEGQRRPSQKAVKRGYLEVRKAQGLPLRCDIPTCVFHSAPLVWNGAPITLILDHVSGNSHDNTLVNLRLLCPNCNSQQETTGGSNKGRIARQASGSYQVQHRSGRLDAHVAGQTHVQQVSTAEMQALQAALVAKKTRLQGPKAAGELPPTCQPGINCETGE